MHFWDKTSCSCKCKRIEECRSSGTKFDYITCSCIKVGDDGDTDDGAIQNNAIGN